MVRQIIQIDEEKCNGCGICAKACHEGAIAIIDGKAKLTRDDYCDGFGDCLPGCPTGAISFIEKDTLAYDEEAVMENKKKKEEAAALARQAQTAEQVAGASPDTGTRSAAETGPAAGASPDTVTRSAAEAEPAAGASPDAPAKPAFGGCPGSRIAAFNRGEQAEQAANAPAAAVCPTSQLRQWPCQIKLVPVNAPYFDGAKLLIAADCTAYAYANVHQEFMRGKITLIGCPKLDSIDYSEKLTTIIANNNIREVTVLRMEVPCCGGLENAVITALKASGKFIPWQVVTFTIDGKIKD